MLTKLFLTLLLTVFAGLEAGCYYTHLASGQVRMLLARRDVGEMIADPETPENLRQHLELVQQVRVYAAEIGLDVDGQYTSFVDWPGDRVITTVVATRPGEIDAAELLVSAGGKVPYKGFFDEERARSEAEKLRSRGLDVCLFPIPAYSTLGWLDDPLTAPMLREGRGRLIETILHELVHATVYVRRRAGIQRRPRHLHRPGGRDPLPGGSRGTRARAAAGGGRPRRGPHPRRISREGREALRGERSGTAARRLACGPREPDPRGDRSHSISPPAMRQRLAEEVRLNDACQALTGTYHGDLTRYGERLRELGGDLRAFLEDARRAAEEPDPRSSAELTPGRGRSPEDPD